MKKIITIFTVCVLSFILSGCANGSVTTWGGTKEIYLPDNMKFINYNIQDSSTIWCTYRPMRETEQAEKYYVAQDVDMNLFGEGTFIIYESKNGERAQD